MKAVGALIKMLGENATLEYESTREGLNRVVEESLKKILGNKITYVPFDLRSWWNNHKKSAPKEARRDNAGR